MSDGQLFGVLLLPNAGDVSDQPLVMVDDQGRNIRQRRYHAKSKAGCVACKQRRVKCDEVRPTCGRCSSRNVQCQFEAIPDRRQQRLASRRVRQGQACPQTRDADVDCVVRRKSNSITQNPGLGDVDMTALRLMHHFEHSTSATLVLGKSIWRDQVLPLALQHEQLMCAILMIAATHLHHLQPAVGTNARAAAYYLDRTLASFRASLEAPPGEQDPDVMISCAFILLHYTWATPFFSLDETEPDPASDKLIPFASGLKSVILRANDVDGQSPTIFGPLLKPATIRRFKDWVATVEYSYDFQENFMLRSRAPVLGREEECWEGCGSVHAADRLVPIFQTIEVISRGEDMSWLMSDIQAYSLMWPAKANKKFEEEVGANRADALVVMLAFYASMAWLLADEVWWAERRSRGMLKAILAYLEREAESEWKECARRICEYFGFRPDGTIEGAVGGSRYTSSSRAVSESTVY
ncbi:hypothetical protein F5Y06DRAFT_269185 [Hypoxylon sp. FL0890]|nr:hypothetical protein F5Y06DRAFT_269185 [Hypoxylon sp. FL0890]